MKSPIQSLEVFDAAAVNFFVHNPAKIIFGAGRVWYPFPAQLTSWKETRETGAMALWPFRSWEQYSNFPMVVS